MLEDELQLINALRDESTRRVAFEKMVRKYQEQVYHTVRRMVLVHEDADDIVQNVFIKAWQGLDGFRADSSLGTWLYRIASHETIDFLQKQKHLGVSLDDDEKKSAQYVASKLESDPYFDGDETEIQLQQAIASLPKKQRLVFNMKYFDEMKYEDISAALGTSVGALKASYHLAVQKISAFFGLHD
ncbi:MAG: sigma-70 family RNA polymerase sigma factor [Bacteroidaceae bacterium]|nr:sigma-70 family RNA polymerase sigma factor [Bacteroidaceae bacterium]